MSCEDNANDNSEPESSSGSSQIMISLKQKEKEDLTLYGTSMRLSRTPTVRRSSTLTSGKFLHADSINESLEESDGAQREQTMERGNRRSLDSTYRLSLESISEYKPKHSFSSVSLISSRECKSLESSSSDCTDYAIRSASENTKDKTFLSASSSYLSWIENVNSEYFSSANSTSEVVDVDTKVGEWNNFWLNYNSANNRYLSSPYLSVSQEDKTLEDLSDCKSSGSTQREFTDKQLAMNQIFLSQEEIMETIRCSQRITKILQNALKRNEGDSEESKNDSYYSQTLPALFTDLYKREDGSMKERACSYSFEPQELQKQKQMLKPPAQSGNSCINVLLNTGVGDILKRVINKRREVIASEDTTPRSSFSEWSSGK